MFACRCARLPRCLTLLFALLHSGGILLCITSTEVSIRFPWIQTPRPTNIMSQACRSAWSATLRSLDPDSLPPDCCNAGVTQRVVRHAALPLDPRSSGAAGGAAGSYAHARLPLFQPLPESQPVLPCLLRRLLQQARRPPPRLPTLGICARANGPGLL